MYNFTKKLQIHRWISYNEIRSNSGKSNCSQFGISLFDVRRKSEILCKEFLHENKILKNILKNGLNNMTLHAILALSGKKSIFP